MRLTLDIAIDGESLPVLTWEEWGVACEPVPVPYERIRDDQRRALFAAFYGVFGWRDHERGFGFSQARKVFTRMILGLDVDAPVSWSTCSVGTISASQASRLLDVLDACERVQAIVDEFGAA